MGPNDDDEVVSWWCCGFPRAVVISGCGEAVDVPRVTAVAVDNGEDGRPSSMERSFAVVGAVGP